jgi:hypothetical protein
MALLDNDFDIGDFNFDLDYMQKWEDSLDQTDIVSFDSCEDPFPMYDPHIDEPSSDDSYTTLQSKNDISV